MRIHPDRRAVNDNLCCFVVIRCIGIEPVSYTHLDVYKRQPYVPSEYGDLEWSKSGDSSEVYYTGNPETHMVRSITWAKDNMAYSLFFLEQVKEADAEFYKDHVVPLKSIDSSRYELAGNYPMKPIKPKTIEEIKQEHVCLLYTSCDGEL